jgi:hypothetical protein
MPTPEVHRRARSETARPLLNPPDAAAALASLAPLDRPATICLTLDDHRRPIGSFVVDHGSLGDDPDAVLTVSEDLAELVASSFDVGAVVVASIRPTVPCGAADAGRLLDLTMLLDDVGVDLLEWLVVHPSGVVNMRAASGEPSRW